MKNYAIDIMPFKFEYEDFVKYISKFRNETGINVKYDIKEKSLSFPSKHTKVLFPDMKSAMSYLEGMLFAWSEKKCFTQE